MEVTSVVISKVMQSVNVSTSCKSHYQEEVHLCRRFTSVHFTRVHNNTTWLNYCKDTSSLVMESYHSFGLSAPYKEVSTVIVR